MKKNKKIPLSLRQKYKKIFLIIGFLLFSWVITVFWNDILYSIWYQIATQWGSSNSLIRFSHGSSTDYINKSTDSTVIGNYFTWYYYDSVLWFFKLDWSEDIQKNVRIISSTTKCPSWEYGYKFWWYAHSQYYGFMDFDYSDDIFVYYCENDKKLHGYAYTKYNWFQNFEGIGFEILPSNSIINISWTGLFVNDTIQIGQESTYTWTNSTAWYNSLWGNIFNFDDTKESLFYIIK